MPLEYYAEFNQTIFPRIPKGDNTLNREKIIKICDRNLEWLRVNGKICKTAKPVEVFHVDQPDFKEKVMHYIKKDYPFVMRGVDLKCFETMQFDNLMKIAGNN